MRLGVLVAATVMLAANAAWAEPPQCSDPNVLGVHRTLTIDARGGPGYGEKYGPSRQFLLPREVVLTFDDGPFPEDTRAILDALDAACTKATFFEVGTMAMAHPELTKEVLDRGHTVGTHTWSHANLGARSLPSAVQEIEKAVTALDSIAPRSVAPFFRFPYLSDKKEIRDYLATRDIAMFDIDVDSKDYLLHTPERVVRNIMTGLAKKDGGIILMHDIHKNTAKSVPLLLAALKEADYHVVHIVMKEPVKPSPVVAGQATPSSTRASPSQGNGQGRTLIRKAASKKPPAAETLPDWW